MKIVSKPEFQYFAIDGVYPGDESWSKLVDAIASEGVHIAIRSSEKYEPGIYAYLACASTIDLSKLNEQLKQITATFEHPLIWPLLLEAIGSETELKEQIKIEERYNLE